MFMHSGNKSKRHRVCVSIYRKHTRARTYVHMDGRVPTWSVCLGEGVCRMYKAYGIPSALSLNPSSIWPAACRACSTQGRYGTSATREDASQHNVRAKKGHDQIRMHSKDSRQGRAGQSQKVLVVYLRMRKKGGYKCYISQGTVLSDLEVVAIAAGDSK